MCAEAAACEVFCSKGEQPMFPPFRVMSKSLLAQMNRPCMSTQAGAQTTKQRESQSEFALFL